MYYNELKEIQKLLWKHDDLTTQNTLFELQEKVAGLILKVANKEKKVDDLIESFPWLYEVSKINERGMLHERIRFNWSSCCR